MIQFIISNLHIIVSSLIAFLLSSFEVLFGKYKLNHGLLLRKPRYVIYNGIYYAIIALLINVLVFIGEIKINNFDVTQNLWKTSIILGIITKSIAKINLFTIRLDGKDVPFGFKLFNDFFEDFFVKKISDDADNMLLLEIKKTERKLKSKTTNWIDRTISQCMPSNMATINKESYLAEIRKQTTKFDKLSVFAKKFGVNRMKQIESFIE